MSEKPAAVLARMAGRLRLLALLVLTVLLAVTEGVGILMLVPLLASLSAQSSAGGGLATRLLARLPFKPELGPLLTAFVGLIALRALLQLVRGVEGAKVERRIAEGLRARGASALLHADWRKFGQVGAGEILSALIGGIDRLGAGIHELISLAAVLLLLAAAFVAAITLSPATALAALAGGFLVVLAYGPVRKRSIASGGQLILAYGRLNSRLTETLGALRVLKSHSAEQRTKDELAGIDRRLTANRVSLQLLLGSSQGLLQVTGSGVLAALVWLAVGRWHVPLVVMLPLIALFARVLPLLAAVQQHWSNWLSAAPSLDHTLALIRELEAAAEPQAEGISTPRPRHTIALTGVTVRYAGRETAALDGVDITLPIGTTTALLGPSGAGKSTAADVLGGLVGPDAGVLALDGRALDAVERIAWRRQVAYVQQEPVLFDMSVRENLLWAAPDADDGDLRRALTDASAQFVLDLPRGLDTPVGGAGRQLSGGERQRIVLARALLRAPALLILDEPTSALDPANERAIAEAVSRMHGRLTVLIIGHRGALTRLAERQVRLESGRVAAATEHAM